MKIRHALCILVCLVLLSTVAAAGSPDAPQRPPAATAVPQPETAPRVGSWGAGEANVPPAVARPDAPADSTTRVWGALDEYGSDHPDRIPAIAANANGDWLLVYEQEDGTSDNIRAQYIAWTGGTQGGSFEIAASDSDESHPAVAYDEINDRFLVVWAEELCTITTPRASSDMATS